MGKKRKSRKQARERRIAVGKVSKPYRNPLITAKGTNPIRIYRFQVKKGGKVEETLTGVIFHNQTIRDQIQHHASLRGHGKLERIRVLRRRLKI